MRRSCVLVSLILLAACPGKRDEPRTDKPVREPGPIAEVREEPDELSDAWVEPRRAQVLVFAGDPDASEASVRPVALGGAGEHTLLAPVVIPPTRVLAHGGGQRFAFATSEPGSSQVELWGLSGGNPIARVEVGEQAPAALHMVGERVFIGQTGVVSTIDFAAAEPRQQALRERPEMKFKAYDLFTRDRGWLIAIDDRVRPFYADSVDLSPTGASHRASFELPRTINGHYSAAALHATGPGRGTLYAIVPYGIMSGSGHDLVSVPLRDAVPAIDASTITINSGWDSPIPVIEEHVPRGIPGEPKLRVGDQFTAWTALSWAEGLVLIAAGARGLLILPDDFRSDANPTAIDIGGSCLDVLSDGGRIWALRGAPATTALVELEVRGGAPTPTAVLELDGPYSRFVH